MTTMKMTKRKRKMKIRTSRSPALESSLVRKASPVAQLQQANVPSHARHSLPWETLTLYKPAPLNATLPSVLR